MGVYYIKGGNPLGGCISIGGGKNAILPILASVVLNNGVSIIHNCPKISDTYISIEMLRSLGCKVDFDGKTIVVDSSEANNCYAPESLVKEMRSSIIFLGGILGRFKEVHICYPGGCELGLRPIDLHLKSLRQMGVCVTEENGFIHCKADNILGANIHLDFPSVGATENVMLSAVLAKGETILQNAAREPEIVDLQNFLNAMGAKVSGAGTSTIVISGVEKLDSVEYSVMPDRIVAGTYLVAAAMTKGQITLEKIVPEHIYPITSKLQEAGCHIHFERDRVHLRAPLTIKPIDRLSTQPHPGFPTDMQSQFMALLCLANGTSVFHETVFESRNKHIPELIRLGADIILSKDGKTSTIKGVDGFKGAAVEAKDLRGGAALILAGLAAQGHSIVCNSLHVERGYESIESDLRCLGGDIVLRQT